MGRTKYTVKEASKLFFDGTVSEALIYRLVNTNRLPHVRVGGKVLLDVDTLTLWWQRQLLDSMQPETKKQDPNQRLGELIPGRGNLRRVLE